MSSADSVLSGEDLIVSSADSVLSREDSFRRRIWKI